MSSSYRSYEERHAAAEATAAEAAMTKAKAESFAANSAINAGRAAAEAQTANLAEQLKQTKMRARLAEVEREQADAAKDASAQRRAEKAEARAEGGIAFKRMTLIAVIVLLAVALPAQLSFFLGLHKPGEESTGPAWLLAPAPLGLELLAWVGVSGTSWARRKGLPLAPFWGLTAALAGFAGWINFSHTSADFGPVAGATLGAFSLLAPLLWELREWMDSRAAVDSRGRAQRAADKAKAKKAAAEAKLDRQHDEKRRQAQPEVWAEFEQILTAAPRGSVDREAAWADAWYRVHRAPLGYTEQTYRAMVDADSRLAEVLGMVTERSVYRDLDRELMDLLGGGEDDGGTPSRTLSGGPSGGPSQGAADTPLGRVQKGRAASGSGDGRDAGKAPTDEDVRKVLAIAAKGRPFPGIGRIRSEAGVTGGTEYLQRVRDAARARFDGQ
ncbi:hypothetical protein [Kitasatospora cineracea]|uniref:DUF2637 domain-containing protein n=1 Tax=Kitasatospora cineracea TaxID=88074 RepID=A0A3N4QZ77_9ACTN|nr:hypothetical protein [Kitasatospora cineracea]RPE26613.1 hypothetical protein EDD38_7674 [Kitasatospora cineracea]